MGKVNELDILDTQRNIVHVLFDMNQAKYFIGIFFVTQLLFIYWAI